MALSLSSLHQLRYGLSRLRQSPATQRVSWALVICMMVAYPALATWLSAPERAEVLQVLFPHPLIILTTWYLALLSMTILRLLVRRDFTITSCAVMTVLAVPMAWSEGLESIPGLDLLSPSISPTLIQALPIPIIVVLLACLPRWRSLDRILFAGVGVIAASLHLLFHLLLSIPEADLSRERQAAILELIARQPPAELMLSAEEIGGVLLGHDIVRNPELHLPLPAAWGEGAEVVFANLVRILDDRPATTHVSTERGNTIFERIGYLYDGRDMEGQHGPRIYLFPSTSTNQSLLNAQRAHFSLAAIGGAFWFVVAMILSHFHARRSAKYSPRRKS